MATLLDTKTVNVATVLAAEVKGVIENITYWNAASGQFVATQPTNIAYGAQVGAQAYMRNTGAASQRMYMVFTLKRPDGTVKSTFDGSSSPTTLAPNASDYKGWVDVADQAGTWTMVIQLYGEAA